MDSYSVSEDWSREVLEEKRAKVRETLRLIMAYHGVYAFNINARIVLLQCDSGQREGISTASPADEFRRACESISYTISSSHC